MLKAVMLLLLEMRQRYVTSILQRQRHQRKANILASPGGCGNLLVSMVIVHVYVELKEFMWSCCWGRLMFQICSTQLRWGTTNSSPLWNKGSSEQSLKSSMLCWGAPVATDLWPPACVFLSIKGQSRWGSDLHTELQIHQNGGGAAEQSRLKILPQKWASRVCVFAESQEKLEVNVSLNCPHSVLLNKDKG